MSRQARHLWLLVASALVLAQRGTAAEVDSFETLETQFSQETRPLVKRFCTGCHSAEEFAGDLDLEQFGALPDVRRSPQTWQKVAEMLSSGEMPPAEARQPSAAQRKQLRSWIERYLHAEAQASAGDPGPVVLRRLTNAEYTYTVRDLTGVDLQPAREFPVDGAAGEGFTNAGQALVMSPALLTKYFDAGKEIASHAVLLPDGIRFSAGASRRDWTDEILGEIKTFYAQFADGEGRLPLEKYFAATLDEREGILTGAKTVEDVASQRGLNARYLGTLWTALTETESSPMLDSVRARWRAAQPGEAAALTAEIVRWQQVLTRFQNVGHMKSWMLPVSPITSSQEFRAAIPAPASGNEVAIYLGACDAGDGNASDYVVWQQPRLVTPGRPDVLLRDLRAFSRDMAVRRQRVFASAAKSLRAAAEASAAEEPWDVAELARKHDVEVDVLAAWLAYVGIHSNPAIRLDHFQERIDAASSYDFVKGWGTSETPQLLANSSDQHVRIPGNMKPHGVVMHPSPQLNAAVGWQSPLAGSVRIEGQVTHAHPECGNDVTWSLELRRGSMRQRLASGTAAGASAATVGPIEKLNVLPGDLVSLSIGPRDGNHSCDLTDVELTLRSAGEDGREWNLARDVSSNVLAGNPHADGFGNAEVWHFYTEPVQGNENLPIVPEGSLLARWQLAAPGEEQQKLADAVQTLLVGGPSAESTSSDAALYRRLASLSGPLLDGVEVDVPAADETSASGAQSFSVPLQDWVLDPALFGRHPNGSAIDAASLCVQAPSTIEVRLPADLVAGSELVVTGVLHRETAAEGSVQLQVGTSSPESQASLRPDTPLLVQGGSETQKRFEAAFDDFRRVFPAAICYSRIVPVDEVITLTLFHREDEPLCRLMLDEAQRAKLDRLWAELRFVSQDALTTVDAFAQLMEYATQDGDPRTLEPLRQPIDERAAALRQQQLDAEPRHLESLIELAGGAYRRPLTESEVQELRGLYGALRNQALPHDEALRLTLARVLVAPAFLYRLEKSPDGAQPGPLADWELASRLSYFLWSSLPDAELRELAASGKLTDPDMLVEQSRRMLADPRTRRLATEFACQWLHIYDFDTLDEKSEKHFPTFAALRSDMYEESIRFFTDAFQRDASVLELFDADHTFLNEALAAHYGIPGVTGPQWRRVDGVKGHARGGILGLSATLAKQSGASRTSPILRGNWVVEVLLGEKLPRPPKDVPQLPDDEAATEGFTVRQLVERHTSDASCAVCHVRMDPYGFSLESFDAIGRLRDKDLGDRPIDAHAKLQDGAEFDGISGLRTYLLTERRDAVVRQFCKKLLGYALGRGVQLSDGPLLDDMQAQLENNDYRFSSAVETILRSRQFREIRGKDTPFVENLVSSDPQSQSLSPPVLISSDAEVPE